MSVLLVPPPGPPCLMSAESHPRTAYRKTTGLPFGLPACQKLMLARPGVGGCEGEEGEAARGREVMAREKQWKEMRGRRRRQCPAALDWSSSKEEGARQSNDRTLDATTF